MEGHQCWKTQYPFIFFVGFSVSNSARRYPLSYVFSGYYRWGNGNLNNQDSDGYWWSTAAYSDSIAYYLSMYSSGLYPQTTNSKTYGFSLRYSDQRRVIMSVLIILLWESRLLSCIIKRCAELESYALLDQSIAYTP